MAECEQRCVDDDIIYGCFAPAAVAALLVLTNAAYAADVYPSKTVRFVVRFPPGGATDVVKRVMRIPMFTG